MENLSKIFNIGVNSYVTDTERLSKSMKQFLHDRVWSDDDLLGGFQEEEIDVIIKKYI